MGQYKGHQAAVTRGNLDAAGDRLVIASVDQTVRVWAGRGRQQLARLSWPHGPVEEVAFTPDGRRVCVHGRDVTRAWDLDILGVARARRPRGLTADERERYEVPPPR